VIILGTHLTRAWLASIAVIGCLLSGIAAWRAGSTSEVLALLAFAWITALLAVIDLVDKRLPNPVTLAAYPIIGGLLLIPAIADRNWGAYGRAWAACLILLALYLILALASPSGLGMGDVKLAGSIGLVLGWDSWTAPLWATALAFVIGGVVSLALLAARRATRRSEIPFGPWMLLAAWSIIAL